MKLNIKTAIFSLVFVLALAFIINFISASYNAGDACNPSEYNWQALNSNVCDYGVSLDGFANGRTPCREPNSPIYKNGVLVSSTTCSDTYKKQQMTLNCLFALSDKSYYTYFGLHPKWQNTSGKGLRDFVVNGKNCHVNIAASVFNPYYVPYRGNVNNIILPDGINYIEGGNEYFSTFMINLNCGDEDKRYNWIPGYSKFNITDRSFTWNPVAESLASAFFGYNRTKFTENVCTRECAESDWTFILGECQPNNLRTKTWIKIGNCIGGVSHSSSENISCNYIPSNNTNSSNSTCTSFTYSGWSSCVNNVQTRTVLFALPANCVGGNPVLTQACNSTIPGNETSQTNVTQFIITNITTIPAMPFINNGTTQNISVNFSSSTYPIIIIFKLFNSSSVLINNQSYVLANNSALPVNYKIPSNLSNGFYYLWLNATNNFGNSTQVLVGNFTVNKSSNGNQNNETNEDDEDKGGKRRQSPGDSKVNVIKLGQNLTAAFETDNGILRLGKNTETESNSFKTAIYWLVLLILLLLIVIVLISVLKRLERI
jgi:hypothetical protein